MILSVKPPNKNDAVGLPGYDKDYMEKILEKKIYVRFVGIVRVI